MKYSKEQILAIQQRTKNIQREIDISNKRNKSIQEVLIDKQIDENLLDQRNHGDIESDQFARKNLLNEYSNDLVKGNSYEFQQKIMDGGYDEFFLNNFPKIKQESRMYRVADSSNMFDLVKRLYNIAQREIDLSNERTNMKINEGMIVSTLGEIKNNLEQLVKLKTNSTVQYQDALMRITALESIVQNVGNQVDAMKTAFGANDATLLSALDALRQSTQIPQTPNQAPPQVSDVINQLTPEVLQSTFDAHRTPGQVDTDDEEFEEIAVIDRSDELLQKLGDDLLQYTDADYKRLEKVANDGDVDRTTFASYLSKLTRGMLNVNQIGLNKNKSKGEMLNFFMKKRRAISNDLSSMAEQDRRKSSTFERDKELENKRIEDDRLRAEQLKKERRAELEKMIEDCRNRIDAVERVINDIKNVIDSKPYLNIILKNARQKSLFKRIFTGIDGRSNADALYMDMSSVLEDAYEEFNIELNELQSQL